jgi:hypothetical protein
VDTKLLREAERLMFEIRRVLAELEAEAAIAGDSDDPLARAIAMRTRAEALRFELAGMNQQLAAAVQRIRGPRHWRRESRVHTGGVG